MARLVRKWALIALLVLVNAMLLGAVAVILWAIYLTAPTRGGISGSEYIEAWDAFRFVIHPGAAGLLALAVTTLYWFAGLRWLASGDLTRKSAWALRISLVLVPLSFALLYATILLVNADPEMWRPFPPRR